MLIYKKKKLIKKEKGDKMYKKILVILSVLSLFILAGCTGNETTIAPAGTPYFGGSQGVIAYFEDMGIYNDKTGINEIFEGETFPIEINLKNKGEHEIAPNDVKIKLLGIKLTDFNGIVSSGELKNTDTIEKVSEYLLEGGEETIDFTSGSNDAEYKIDLAGSTYDINIFASVEYEYQTYAAVPQVCFKEDLTDPSICEVNQVKSVYSSAAPLQVVNVEEKSAGTGKVSLEFEIRNVGGGDVTIPDSDFDPRYNKLEYEISDASQWDCSRDEIRLDSTGYAKLICRLKEQMPDNTLYTKEVDLTLKYKYKELITKPVRIKEQ